jgi:hypothetical protein
MQAQDEHSFEYTFPCKKRMTQEREADTAII